MLALAVTAAFGAALCFAGGSVAQHVAASRVPVERVLSPRLLIQLAGNRLWLLAFPLDAVGIGLQALALREGTLLVVQPMVAIGLAIAVPIRAAVERRRPPRGQWVAVLVCTAALTVLLAALHPTAGHADISPGPAAYGFGGVAALTLLLAMVGRRRPAWAAGTTATGAGLMFGASGVLLKLVATGASEGLGLLGTWPPYVLVLFGATGLLLSQNAFQAASLAYPLALLTVVEPVTSIGLAVWLLGERAPVGPARALVIAATAAVLLSGLVFLSLRRDPATRSAGVDH